MKVWSSFVGTDVEAVNDRLVLVPSSSRTPEGPSDRVTEPSVYAGPPTTNVAEPTSSVEASPDTVKLESMVKVCGAGVAVGLEPQILAIPPVDGAQTAAPLFVVVVLVVF